MVHLKYWECWGLVFDPHVSFYFYMKKKGWVKEFHHFRIHGKPVINVLICTM